MSARRRRLPPILRGWSSLSTGLYAEELHVLDSRPDQLTRPVYDVYRQAVWRHVSARLMQELTLHTRPLEQAVDRLLIQRLSPEQRRDPMRIPFGLHVDLAVYDFAIRGRTYLIAAAEPDAPEDPDSPDIPGPARP